MAKPTEGALPSAPPAAGPAEPGRRAASYHHGDLRAALRNEAQAILEQAGVAEVSLREVARRVGVSHAAPYRHYANREALLAEVAAAGFERLGERFARMPAEADAGRRFTRMAHTYVEFARQEPAVYRLMFGDSLKKGDHPVLASAGFATFGFLRAMIVALGVPAPATMETMAAWSFAHGMALLIVDQRLESEPGVDAEVDHEVLIDRSAGWFLAGLQADLARQRGSPDTGSGR